MMFQKVRGKSSRKRACRQLLITIAAQLTQVPLRNLFQSHVGTQGVVCLMALSCRFQQGPPCWWHARALYQRASVPPAFQRGLRGYGTGMQGRDRKS